ncbi:MAG: fused MFS/spermidine synthase [Labilithrix sp.]
MEASSESALRARKQLLLVAVVILVFSEVLALAGIGRAPHQVLWSYLRYGHRVFSAAFVAAAVMYVFRAPSRGHRNAALVLGLAFEVGHIAILRDVAAAFTNFGGGFGVAALVVAGVETARARGEERVASLVRLLEASLFPLYALVAFLPLDLSVLLHPYTLDAPLLAIEGTVFGGQPSFAIGRAVAEQDALHLLASFVYVELPVVATIVYVLERRAGRKADLQISFLVAGLLGIALYHAAPAAGPSSYWQMYPQHVPPLARAFDELRDVADTRYRNCLPSLHTTWALLVVWHARSLGRAAQVAFAAWAGAIVLAMLGLGEHYLIDVVVSVPFAVAVRALTSRGPARWAALAGSAALFAAWLLVLRGPRWLFDSALVLRALAVLTTVAAVALERRLHRSEQSASAGADPAAAPPALSPRVRLIVLIFFASGFAGLLYEVVFAKALALVFGSTAVASTTVLATYMGGMALGSYVGGRVKVRSALRAYAFCELGVGASCALSPVMVSLVRSAYVGIASGSDPGRPWIVAMQVALGALVLLPPTVLMGMTLPILARHFEREDPTLGRSVALLYAANTGGAAAGALSAGYLLLPLLGVFGATLLGVAANLGVALGALRLAARPAETEVAEAAPPEARIVGAPSLGWLAVGVLGAGGLVSLGLEITYTHLLAIVVGNSTYAFSSMLVSFLVGLASGAAVGRRWLRAGHSLAVGIGIGQAGLVAVVLLGVFAWNGVPAYFASYQAFTYARTFAISEFIRFVVCACLLVPPAFFVGMSYPLSMEAVVRASRQPQERALGNAAAINTLGNIAGSLVTGFLLVPRLGALRTLHVLMAITALLVVGAIVVSRGERLQRLLVGAFGIAAVLAVVQPSTFDLSQLAAGSNVYFKPQNRGAVIDSAESMEGGLTTVCLAESDGEVRKTLFTNGKFQGDDSSRSEMRAQYAFTLMPLLHTTARGPALVIGFGTGTSARAVQDSGFSQVHVVELSRDIVEMSQRHFARANANVVDRPNVHVSFTDGRNFLQLRDSKWDFIGVEISSIWFAGAASLYNVEFYELSRRRLSEQGVFQQWIQLHHVDAADIVSMLASVRAVYDHVWLYVAGGQGVVVACPSGCPPTAETIAKLQGTPELAKGFAILGDSAADLERSRVFTPEATDRFLAAAGAPPSDRKRLMWVASTDDNVFLEYHTPRGNIRNDSGSFERNLALLNRFAAR